MAKTYKAVSINIGGGDEAFFLVREDVLSYFNIAEATISTQAFMRERRAHTRKIYNGLTGDVTRTVAVPLVRFQDTKSKVSAKSTGKIIKVPTELTSNGIVRFVTLRIPGSATNFAIANWINTKFTAHKPTYFLTSSGVRYPTAVTPLAGDINPPESAATP